MIRSLALPLLLALSVTACAKNAPPATDAIATAPTATEPEAAPPSQPAPEASPALSETEQATAAQESVANLSDEDREDASLERLAQLPANQQLPAGRWKAGTNYTPLSPAQSTSVPAGKVEVVEVFWYGCGHCYALEPFVQSWLQKKADYVEFVKAPVMWGPAHRAHARLFYTLKALNRDDLHAKVFETIHQKSNMLIANSEAATEKMQTEWATQNGVKAADFTKAYNSFSVNSNLQRAEELTRRYSVQGVPLIVINGKYTTDVGAAGSPADLFVLINDLTAAEHKKR